MFWQGLEGSRIGYADSDKLASFLSIEYPYVGLHWEAAKLFFIKSDSHIQV